MTSAAPQPPVLNADNLREMQTARVSLRKIRRAVLSAKIEGYSVAICGALTVAMGMGSIWQMLGGTVLAVIGVIEIVGGTRLGKLDIDAVRILTINQLSLAVLILMYALWMLHSEMVHPADLADLGAAGGADLGQMGSSIQGLTHEIMLLMYGSMILAAAVEAGMAAYYHSRGAHLRRYLSETPAWIIAMQKAGMTI